MKGPERRAQLIEEATKLFSQKGFNGTTTKEIAASAGINEALIFKHFENKEALYRAVIHEYVERSQRQGWHDGIRDCMRRNADADLFRKLISYVIEAYRAEPVMQRLVLFAILEGYHEEADRACHLPKTLQREVIQYIVRRQGEGKIAPMDPAAAFQILFGMSRSYAIGKYVYKLKEMKVSDASVEEEFTRFAVRALVVESKRKRRHP
ncbi:TetR/AcrR family transcriptional regulator [Terriglobus tenax]|uniref:TetR/AcrR family transcriptional regulator n=1 Tax=Terriglobus tenax TaxID=1111115 RepID=UPI0021E0799F|nr:TetR/AcrR family transcriptional regulator [Terriglobus tenax]